MVFMSIEWIEVNLEDICINQTKKAKDLVAENIERYVGLEHIEPENLLINSWGLVKDGTTFTKLFYPGQVLFGKRRSYQKKAAVANFKGVCSGDILVLEAKGDIIIPELLPYIIQNDRLFDYAVGTSSGSLSPRTSWKHLSSYKIKIPKTKDLQREILDNLNNVEQAIIEKNNVALTTKKYKAKLAHKLLTTGIDHQRFKETEIGEIPIDWNLMDLGSLCVAPLSYGANESAIDYNVELPRYVRITDITDDGKLIPSGLKSAEIKNEDYILKTGDIVVARTGATVGKSYLYNESDGVCAYAGYLIRIRANKEVLLPSYLIQIMHSLMFYKWIKVTLKEGAQPNINSKEYASYKIALPTIEEQAKIVAILLSIDDQIQSYTKEISKLIGIKKALQEQLL
jgi:restriction endonuclease S subunit